MLAMAEKLLTTEEVAEMLSISEATVKRLLRSGDLGGYKISGVWRIAREDFEDYLRKQRNTPKDK